MKRFTLSIQLLLFASPLALAPAQQRAGATTTVPPFALGASPLALRGDVRPAAFISAVGRRAIAMGTEDGR
ncbi:MAG TPA: hypothetical protein VLN49_24805, partial [Gemmatimonadaceae bacterium]|nr:hypothetical protein [Gemmatimonadaceae bacterium]